MKITLTGSENEVLTAYIWRRGRGVIAWKFRYVIGSPASWFTTPGWYRTARRYTYRLTVDHDYATKPIWLGKRVRGRWVNMESLYEPIFVTHRNFAAIVRDPAVPKRTGRKRSLKRIGSTVEQQVGLAVLAV